MIKKLLQQSKYHWLMCIPTAMIASGVQNPKTIYFFWLSLIVGVMIEFYQYIGRAFVQNKPITKEYVLYSVFDIFITVIAGAIGSLFFKFLNFYI
jgi:hypothetical protein